MKSRILFTLGLGLSALSAATSLHSASANDIDTALLRNRILVGGPKIAAHQGGIFGLKGNTLSAFKNAAKNGASIVEMDLRISKDGVPMVFHDEELDTWTFCKGLVREKTAAEIQKCHFKLNFHHIPTFESVLQWSKGDVIINAEFKDVDVIPEAIKLLKKYNAHGWVYFQATSWEKYQKARAADEYAVLLVAPKTQEELALSLELNDDNLLVIEVVESMRTPENIKAIHDANKLASEDVWHFSKTAEFFRSGCEKGAKAGLDIVVTNHPDSCFRQLLMMP